MVFIYNNYNGIFYSRFGHSLDCSNNHLIHAAIYAVVAKKCSDFQYSTNT